MFRERLDAPDLDDDLAHMPAAEAIAAICRDLGLPTPPGMPPGKRRTPAEAAALAAWAAAPPGASAMPLPRPPPPKPPPQDLPNPAVRGQPQMSDAELAEAMAKLLRGPAVLDG